MSRGSSETGFDEAENKKRNKSDLNREQERRVNLRSKYVRRKRNEASDSVEEQPSNGNRVSGLEGVQAGHHLIFLGFELCAGKYVHSVFVGRFLFA